MNILKAKKLLYNQTPLKILSFLSVRPGTLLSAREISQHSHSSKGATHKTLKLLLNFKIISRQQKGNVFIYILNDDNIILKQFKVLENVLKLQPLIKKIQYYSYQIILFGSWGTGTNTMESDIDLFIKSEHKKKLTRLINQYSPEESHVNPVILDELEIIQLKKEDKVFFDQVKKGLLLWEGKPDYEKF